MKIYNITGYLIIFSYMLACMYSAPAHLGPWTGMLIGGVYFIFCWFLGGLYLADVLHLGIAHRSLDYKEWFIKVVTVVNNIFGLYVDPIAWVNRHRLHHKHADHDGDPNKLSGDGFWRTLYLCVMPYQCKENLAGDKILKSRTFRVVANPLFGILAQAFSFYLLWKLVGALKFALVMWVGMRIFALWVFNRQIYEISWLGEGHDQGCGVAQGRSIGRAGFLGRSFSFCKRFNRLPEEVRRNFFAVQAVTFRPHIGIVVRSKNSIDPRKMNGEVVIDALFLRSVVPMMISGHNQKLF